MPQYKMTVYAASAKKQNDIGMQKIRPVHVEFMEGSKALNSSLRKGILRVFLVLLNLACSSKIVISADHLTLHQALIFTP